MLLSNWLRDLGSNPDFLALVSASSRTPSLLLDPSCPSPVLQLLVLRRSGSSTVECIRLRCRSYCRLLLRLHQVTSVQKVGQSSLDVVVSKICPRQHLNTCVTILCKCLKINSAFISLKYKHKCCVPYRREGVRTPETIGF